MEDINRTRAVLVEKKKTNKWLAHEMRKDPATVSKWCTNSAQPDLLTMVKIASLLDVDIKDLLCSTKKQACNNYKNSRFYLNSTGTNIGFVKA